MTSMKLAGAGKATIKNNYWNSQCRRTRLQNISQYKAPSVSCPPHQTFSNGRALNKSRSAGLNITTTILWTYIRCMSLNPKIIQSWKKFIYSSRSQDNAAIIGCLPFPSLFCWSILKACWFLFLICPWGQLHGWPAGHDWLSPPPVAPSDGH